MSGIIIFNKARQLNLVPLHSLICTLDCEWLTWIKPRHLRLTLASFYNTLDKINFNQARADEIEQLHERVAQRFHNLIVTNQGLWIKAGQALGLQAALLPKPYREAFADIFDDAPTIPYDEVEKVFRQDCGGRTPDEVFDSFEHQAVNSASIAQVHRAKVRRNEVDKDGKPTGKSWLEDVAVKVSLFEW